MNNIHTPEHAHTMFGVEGRMGNRVIDEATGLFRNQRFIACRPCKYDGASANITVEVRFDDECKNGQQSFAITGHIQRVGARDWDTGGCIHEDIAKHFPKLAHLIKWHLTDTRAPMHYVANAVYHASNRDHNGLLKGEERQIVNGKTGLPCWHLEAVGNGADLPKQVDALEKPEGVLTMVYVPWTRTGEGKERDFDAARRAAVWPEATDEQLSLPKEELTALLTARLPALAAAFRADMEAAGFLWEQPVKEKT